MAKLNFDYYEPKSDDVYSDGDVEFDLLQYAKAGECNWYQDGRWPVVYHMSHLRQNILNWYPFKDNCSILEIGAGCGAITGLLCERGAKVVAVELTKRRAEINFQRHQKWANLEVVVSDFQNIPLDWKFDYVIINGVLEYAEYMINSNQPYEDFLEISGKHLNPKGRILLSIENRLGLKYFSGAKEDHTGKYFSGLNGYIEDEKVKTFSKEELQELIYKVKLHPIKFYYPYPDYKFPAEIFTDATVCTMVPTVANYPLDMPRVKLFEERTVYQSFMKDGIMDKFSNSFLVEIANDSNEHPAEMSYVKLSSNRDEKFRIFTYFDKDKKNVYKMPLTSLAEKHLNKMERFNDFEYERSSRLKNVKSHNQKPGLSYPYISGECLEDVLLNACIREDLEEFNSKIKPFKDLLMTNIPLKEQPGSSEFELIFGSGRLQRKLHWMDNVNVDMIAGNIFIDGNNYQVIDYEWHVPCEVPIEFVLWRMLKQLIDDHQLGEFLTKTVIYTFLEIDEQVENLFIYWETHFAKEYVGIKDLYYLSKDIVPLEIEQAVEIVTRDKVLQSTLFFDMGSGFSEFNIEKINAQITPIGFCVTFTKDQLSEAKAIRWDPLEGNASYINIQKIETDGNPINFEPINAERFHEDIGYEFFTFDPQFTLKGDFSEATFIKIYFSCTILDWTQGYRKREEENLFHIQKINEQQIMNQQLLDKIAELQEISKKYQAQLSTLEFEMTQEIKKLENELQYTKESLIDTQLKLTETQLNLTETQLNLTDAQLNLNDTQSALNNINSLMKEHRLKSTFKLLLFGDISRGKTGE